MRHLVERESVHKGLYFESKSCDLCGLETKQERNWGTEDDYDNTIDNTCVKYETGHTDQGYGGYTKTKNFDICPKCFKEKLVPWFESQGATIQESVCKSNLWYL